MEFVHLSNQKTISKVGEAQNKIGLVSPRWVVCTASWTEESLLFILSSPVDKSGCFSGDNTELTFYSAIRCSNTEEYND